MMIKEKLQQVWNWVKKQWKKIIVLVVGGFALAQVLPILTPPEWYPSKNCYIVPERNFENVQFGELRKKIDVKFNQIADELSIAYYCYWIYGQSKPFQKYDVLMTLDENKAQFNELHGLIWDIYTVQFHEENLKQVLAKRIPEEKYNFKYDEQESFVGRKSDDALQKIQDFKDKGIEIQIR